MIDIIAMFNSVIEAQAYLEHDTGEFQHGKFEQLSVGGGNKKHIKVVASREAKSQFYMIEVPHHTNVREFILNVLKTIETMSQNLSTEEFVKNCSYRTDAYHKTM